MDDDFNTALGLSVTADVRQALNKEDKLSEKAAYLSGLLVSFGDVLGLFQQQSESFLSGGQADDAAEIEALIAERNTARANKDWAKADEVRDKLSKMGIILEDNAGKTSWRRS
jgi:cysteinyl-tRNA synthetase